MFVPGRARPCQLWGPGGVGEEGWSGRRQERPNAEQWNLRNRPRWDPARARPLGHSASSGCCCWAWWAQSSAGRGQVGVRPRGPLGLPFPRAGTLGVTPRCLGVGGAWPGDWTRGREAEPPQLCVWVDSAQTRGLGGLAPRTLLGTGLLSDPSYSASCLTEPFAGLPLPPPPPCRAKLGPPGFSPDYSGPGSDLGESAGCAPRVCSYVNCPETWGLDLLVKLVSLGKRPGGEGTLGPGYQDWKIGRPFDQRGHPELISRYPELNLVME